MTAPLPDARLTSFRADVEDRWLEMGEARDAIRELLAEVDRLRAEIGEHQRTVEYFDAQSRRRKEQRDQVRTELATAQAQVWAASTVKCWTNENGQRFVFAEDLAFALGHTPTAPAAPTT